MERTSDPPRLGRLLALAHKSVQASLDRQLVSTGSSFHTWLVLRQVDRHPGASQRELAATVGVEGPTLTHHLDRLVTDGLVERVPHARDRRAWTVRLTETGRRHLAGTDPVADAHNDALAGMLTPDELALITVTLTRILDRYGPGSGRPGRQIDGPPTPPPAPTGGR